MTKPYDSLSLVAIRQFLLNNVPEIKTLGIDKCKVCKES